MFWILFTMSDNESEDLVKNKLEGTFKVKEKH